MFTPFQSTSTPCGIPREKLVRSQPFPSQRSPSKPGTVRSTSLMER